MIESVCDSYILRCPFYLELNNFMSISVRILKQKQHFFQLSNHYYCDMVVSKILIFLCDCLAYVIILLALTRDIQMTKP